MKNLLLSLVFFLPTLILAQEGLKIGEKAPDILITDWIENVPKDQSLEGKYVIMDFWATWCGPCLKAVPHFNELEEEFGGREDVRFISISDETPKKIQATLNRIEFNSIVVSDQNKQTLENYKISGIPVTVMIDNGGILRWVGEPASLTSEEVKAFLENKTKGKASEEQVENEEDLEEKEKEEMLKSPLSIGGLVQMIKEDQLLYDFQLYASDFKGIYMANFLPKAFLKRGDELTGICAGILGVSKISVIQPAEFVGRKFDLNYINKSEKDVSKVKNDLLENITKSLGLTMEQASREVEAYELSLKDRSKLDVSTTKQGGVSDAGTKYIFTRKTPAEIIPTLEDALGVFLVDATGLDKACDFIINKNSFDEMKQSFESYGITLKKVKINRQFYVLKK